MPWAPLPFAGGSYADDARPWSHQDTVNYIPVIAEKAGTRSRMMLRGVPGMRVFAQVGDGPIRGARDVEGKCFIVSGSTLYQMSTLGVATAKGTIPGTGLVSMTHNQIAGGNELVIANGSSGYVYNTKTGALTQITDEAFPGFVQVDYLNQYVIGVEPQRRFWLHSDLADATSYNSIDRYEGEVSPDRIVGIVSTHGQALVLSERSGEFFDNIVTDTAAFQRSQGTAMEKGCISAQTIAKIDNSVLFVGHDGVVYRVDGYTPVRVSTHAIEQALSRCDLTKAFAFVFEDRGHAVYYLTCPDGHTWGFDVSTNEWHRRQSYGLDRWRVNALWRWNGGWWAGDYRTGRIYQLDWAYQRESCDVLERSRTMAVMHAEGNRVAVNALRLEFDTGSVESLAHAGATLTGNLPDATIGDAVSYQYAITRAYPGQTFTVDVVSGALPTGLTVNSAGLVTGTITASGSFAWTLRITDECDNTATLPDSADVSAGLWYLVDVKAPSRQLYVSEDLVGWDGPHSLSTSTIASEYDLGVFDTGTSILYATSSEAKIDKGVRVDGNYTLTTVALPFAIDKLRVFGNGQAVGIASGAASGSPGQDHYLVTLDGGATWTSTAFAPGTGAGHGLLDIARLDSGRFVAVGVSTAGVRTFYYSDGTLSGGLTWTAGSGGTPGLWLAGNGQSIVTIETPGGTTGDVSVTTNGSTWAVGTTVTNGWGARYGAQLHGDSLLLAESGFVQYLSTSANNGGAWTQTAVSYLWRHMAIDLQEAHLVASILSGTVAETPKVSTNGGLAWSDLTLPGGTSGRCTVGYVVVAP